MAQPTQYIIMEPLGGMTDLDSIRMRLAEIGLAREAFSPGFGCRPAQADLLGAGSN
ncbi:hypothetical protein LZK82_15345 [Rhizobium leguminosarum]|nr:hypothetical protein LZK82_15345 [Rhizobium leguminosarum]